MDQSGSLDITANFEQQELIDKAIEIFFRRKDGDLNIWLPEMADKHIHCPFLQICPLIMCFFSFSVAVIKENFTKYFIRLDTLLEKHKLNQREALYYKALREIYVINLEEAYKQFVEIIELYPQDKLALLMLEALAFLTGHSEWLEKLYNKFLKIDLYKDDPDFLGMVGFFYCHQNNAFAAMELIQRGLSLKPDNAWLQHVYAHAVTESNKSDILKAVNYLKENSVEWPQHSRFFEGHNWAHVVLLSLDLNKKDAGKLIEKIYLKHIWGKEKNCLFEQNNAFLVLWSAELNGISIPFLWWEDLASKAQQFTEDYFTPYLTVTSILAVAKVNPIAAEKAVSNLKKHMLNNTVWNDVALPVLQGCLAYIAGDYKNTIEHLSAIYTNTTRMGHSDEQRSIFSKTYFKAKEKLSIAA